MAFAVDTSGAIGLNTAGSHFYIIMLDNDFLKHGSGIRLVGNTRKAANYIVYAQRQLQALKIWASQANTHMGKRFFSVDGGCVDIIISTVWGADQIYIKACTGGDCKVVSSTSEAGLITTLTLKYDAGGARITEKAKGWAAFIDWGDEEGSFVTGSHGEKKTITHEYTDAGEYTVTIKAWNSKTLNSGLSNTAPGTVTGFSKVSDIDPNDQADAVQHAETAALPWVETTTSTEETGRPWSTARRILFGTFNNKTWEFHRTVIDIDLTDEDIGKMIGLLIYSSELDSKVFGSPDPLHRPAIYKDGELFLTIPNNGRLSRGELFEFKDLGDLEGLAQIEFKDTGDYAFPAAHASNTTTVYFLKNTGGTFAASFHAYDCKATKNLTVTVPPPE